ncbi:acetyltransferase [Phenylobacterium sp.]|uniref:acetyltransferase n=1 Tax=Phenylobacterium sp. TaxID=1871053 RepID=UPI00394061CC
MTDKPLIIIGNGEIAEMAHQYFAYDSPHEVAAFAIGAEYLKEATLAGLPVVPLEEIAASHPPDRYDAFVAIGDGQLNRIRRRQFDAMKALGYRLASYVSSKAFVWRNVEIGENCFILEHNVLQPFTKVGDNVTLWSGNHIGHRTVIEDDVFIASHVVVSGFCRIGRSSFVGVNAAFAPHVAVGEDNFIGMSAVVTASTEPDGVYQGHPAERRSVSARRYCRVRD